jgi:hypothetical protein
VVVAVNVQHLLALDAEYTTPVSLYSPSRSEGLAQKEHILSGLQQVSSPPGLGANMGRGIPVPSTTTSYSGATSSIMRI